MFKKSLLIETHLGEKKVRNGIKEGVMSEREDRENYEGVFDKFDHRLSSGFWWCGLSRKQQVALGFGLL